MVKFEYWLATDPGPGAATPHDEELLSDPSVTLEMASSKDVVAPDAQ